MDADGYAWWYVDGLDASGRRGVTIIGFIGSVFSPYYAWSGRRKPLNHSCINVALYGEGGGRWAMTERGAGAVTRDATRFQVGPSAMTWDGTTFTVEIDEIAVPHLSRIRGRVRIIPEAVTALELPMTPDAAHVWRPFAPVARIEVELDRPDWKWSGAGYLDGNFGSRALEADFRYWTWARFPHGRGAAILYDVERRDGTGLAAATVFDHQGGAEDVEPPPRADLRTTFWRVKRSTRADAGHRAQELLRWEDGPFYARAAIRSRLFGEEVAGVHEALDLDRFRMNIVKFMLMTRMPRRAGWKG